MDRPPQWSLEWSHLAEANYNPQIPDEMRDLAQDNGWDGPLEITTWGDLIKEAVKYPDASLEYLPGIPQEEEARGTHLYYWGIL